MREIVTAMNKAHSGRRFFACLGEGSRAHGNENKRQDAKTQRKNKKISSPLPGVLAFVFVLGPRNADARQKQAEAEVEIRRKIC